MTYNVFSGTLNPTQSINLFEQNFTASIRLLLATSIFSLGTRRQSSP